MNVIKSFSRKHTVLSRLAVVAFFAFAFAFASYGQSRHINYKTKAYVYHRDGGTCKCCGTRSDIQYDHVKPYSCGGNSDASNVQLLCGTCNRSKSNGNVCHRHNKVVGYGGCEGNTSYVESTQCSGTTQAGNRCKRKTKSINGRCHQH